jgi:phosphomevalonate kinase
MVAGGYVVLERPNPALVAAVSARVYSVVAPLADSSPGGAAPPGVEIEVFSPQMAQSRQYVVKIEGGSCILSRADDMGPNPYVEATLVNTVALVVHLKGAEALRPFSVSIHGDNAFYVMENEVRPRTVQAGLAGPTLPAATRLIVAAARHSQSCTSLRKRHAVAEQLTCLPRVALVCDAHRAPGW